jgi:hypothetical protein
VPPARWQSPMAGRGPLPASMVRDMSMAASLYLPIDGQERKGFNIFIYNLFYKIIFYLFYIFIDIGFYSCI